MRTLPTLATGLLAFALVAGVGMPASGQPLPEPDVTGPAVDSPAPDPLTGEDPTALEPTMGEYSPDAFAEEAEQLDPELLTAIAESLGQTGAEYLAANKATSDASYVIESVEAEGVELLGSRIDGVELTLYVADETAALAVADRGANVIIGEPEVEDLSGMEFETQADLHNGRGWGYTTSAATGGYTCSLGFVGRGAPGGSNQLVTAGHCGPGSQTVTSQAYMMNSSSPGVHTKGAAIGPVVAGNFSWGNGYDVGRIAISAAGWTPQPRVLTWGAGGNSAPLGTAPLGVTDARSAIVGASLCRSGATTGWKCGSITGVDQTVTVGTETVNVISSTACSRPGDSGGSAVSGTVAIGVLTGSSKTVTCGSPDYRSVYFPMVSAAGKQSINQALPGSWEPTVLVPTPLVVSPTNGGTVYSSGGVLSGRLPNGTTSHKVRLTVSGDPSGTRTATVAADGTWRISLAGLPAGARSYQLVAVWGNYSTSTVVNGSLTVLANPTVARLQGADRYEVAVNISKAGFPTVPAAGVKAVYIVTGQNYPDALSAAPAAVKEGGPLLLTQSATLPTSVKAEIQRLKPAKIVVVGGTNSVSAGVYNELSGLTPKIVRLSGADRYEASRAVVQYAFPTTAPSVYIATGQNFPDALAASAAAGSKGVPVLLVNGPHPTLDQATRTAITRLQVSSIKLAGGPNSVTTGIESQLAGIATTKRLTGADRFEAAVNVNRDAFSTAAQVFISTGYNFPDALAGAALAGKGKSPVYLATGTCLPVSVVADLGRLKPSKVTLLGGPNTLSASVQSLTNC